MPSARLIRDALGLALMLVALLFVGGCGGGLDRSDDPDLKELTPGVRYRDLKEGDGDPCPAGAKVTLRYTGWLKDGTVFDSVPAAMGPAAKPTATFELNNLIAGWKEGVPGMKKGGIRKLVIAPEKGYGAKQTAKIPANSTLIFEVELIDFIPPPPPPRDRRSPAPTDLTKLFDGTTPGGNDDKLKAIGTSGLMYRDLKVGDGDVCPEGANVVMDYIGWLTNGTMFDSSWKPNREPLDMSLRELIKGWQQGVPGMKVGGIRKLVIPAPLAYGERGSPPAVPPNATLIFEIELLGIR